MFCPRCGMDSRDSSFCPRCGLALRAEPPAETSRQVGASTGSAMTEPPNRPTRPVLPFALAGAAVAVIIVLLGAILYIMQTNGSDHAPAAAPATTTTTTIKQRAPVDTPASRSPAPTQPSYSTGPGDVRALPAGLFCRDLYPRGYSYAAAVDYWRLHGQPGQMDIDLNGIPCETVYPVSDVAAYWGGNSLPDSGYLSPGLYCRDLYARGVSYPDAVAYWWSEGSPDRMDIDFNGIPCETVYPVYDVDLFWY